MDHFYSKTHFIGIAPSVSQVGAREPHWGAYHPPNGGTRRLDDLLIEKLCGEL